MPYKPNKTIKAIIPIDLALKILLVYLRQNPHREFNDFINQLLLRGIELEEGKSQIQT